MTSSVELSENAGAGNGSPVLIDLLVRETAARSRPLDFRSAISSRGTGILALAAGVLALVMLAPAFVYPSDYGTYLQRFFMPWQTPGAIPDFTFTIEPGDTVAARGRVLPLAVELTPRNHKIALPRTATLVVTGEDGVSTRHEMIGDPASTARYTIGYRVLGDFRYRIEVGNASSSTFDVTAVVPVDLCRRVRASPSRRPNTRAARSRAKASPAWSI